MIWEDGRVVREASETGEPEMRVPSSGSTTLDRLHLAMLLFSEGRGDALSTFLKENSQDQSLWSLGQALAAPYPAGSEERRWVERVLTSKKSLGM